MQFADGQSGRLTVGIIGGLGPQATADLFNKIVKATPVEREQDHLHILIDNQPDIPDRHRAIAGDGPSAGPALADVARNLERAGADFLILASNTPHFYSRHIRDAVSIPFLDMIDETCDALTDALPDAQAAGLLAAEGCLNAGLYQRVLSIRGVTPLVPDPDQVRELMGAIYAVKLGRAGEEERTIVRALGEQLIREGAEAIIVACTELPLLIEEGDFSRPVFDSTSSLANAAVATALGKRSLPERIQDPLVREAKA